MRSRKLLMSLILVALMTFSFSISSMTTGCGGGGGSAAVDETPPIVDLTDPQGDFDGDGQVNDLDEDDDGDGSLDADDCNPFDASVYPGAVDNPDIDYVDSNCDGVDGDVGKAVWVSVDEGTPGNPGTIDQPVDTVTEGMTVAKSDPANIKDVYVVAGEYTESVEVTDGVSVYGGFDLLVSGSRDRNIEENESRLVGDGVASADILIGGGTETLRYTLFINHSDSVVDGLTMVGTDDGFTVLIRNSNARVRNNTINDSYPTAPRDTAVTIGVTTDSGVSGDYSVEIADNHINMRGNDNSAGGVNVGVIAIPEDGAENSMTLSVTGNTIKATGESDSAMAIYAMDNDSDPADDAATDGNASYSLIADGNLIDMSGIHDGTVGIMAGPMLGGSISPDRIFIESAMIANNQIFLTGTQQVLLGIFAGYVRSDSNVENNIISITGNKVEAIALSNMQGNMNAYYNTIFVEGGEIAGYGISSWFRSDTPESLNYSSTSFGEIINNTVYMNVGGCYDVVGILESNTNDDITLLNRVSPARVMNNDLYIRSGCPSSAALYIDEQRPDPAVAVQDIDDLNNKTGFRVDDRTVISGNISADPAFENPILRDFNLWAGSPCIDAGYNFEEGHLDITGVARPQGIEVDIGAYER